MDNKAYLDQIAVKSQNPNTGSLLSPGMIKLIIGGAIAAIAMLIIGSLFSTSNDKFSSSYDDLYYRISTFSKNNGLLSKYDNKLKSSDLRAYTVSLTLVLTTTNNDLATIANSLGVDPNSPDSKVKSAFDSEVSTLDSKLTEAHLTGQFDRTYAYLVYDQITKLLNLELEIAQKTTDDRLASIIAESTKNLTTIQKQFKDYSDSH